MPTLTLTPTLEMIIGRNPRFPTIPVCNSFLVRDEVTCLIDTAAGPELLPLAGSGRVERLLHTHVHADHVNYNFLFPRAEVWAPAYAAPALASDAAFLAYSGYGRLGPVAGIYSAREHGFWPCPVAATFRDGDILEFGRTRLRAIHAPGHAVDHMLLYHEESGTLISTDIDLTPWGPWYGNPGSDLDRFADDIRRIRELAPRVLVSSHRAAPLAGEELAGALEAYGAVIHRRDRRILDLLAEPRTLAQLVDCHPIYRTYPHPEQLGRLFEETMVAKHLERLIRRGAVAAEGGVYRRIARG